MCVQVRLVNTLAKEKYGKQKSFIWYRRMVTAAHN